MSYPVPFKVYEETPPFGLEKKIDCGMISCNSLSVFSSPNGLERVSELSVIFQKENVPCCV